MQFEMPKPGAAHERLRQLCGHWTASETMLPDGEAGQSLMRGGHGLAE